MFQNLEDSSLYKIVSFAGLILMGFNFYNYWNTSSFPVHEFHSGLRWFFLALELCSDYDQITNIVGRVGDENLSKNLGVVLQILELDFLYIFIYSIYLLGIFAIASKLSSTSNIIRGFFYLLLIIIIVLDSAQNLILSEILNSNLSNPRIELIYYLPRITIFLWILIFINLGISGILLWMGTTDLHIRIISLFLFLPQIFSLFSLWGRINLLEVGLEIALPGLIGFFIHSIWKMVTNFFYKTSATIF
jgi:hypothetical protein